MLEQRLVLPSLIADRAAATPDRIWLQHVDGTAMTYGEAESRIVTWATGLRSQGVERGDTVVVMMPNSFDAALMYPAVARRGGIEVAINNAYRGAILTHVVNNSEAKVGVVDAGFVDRFEAVRADLLHLETIVVVNAADHDLPVWGGTTVRAEDVLTESDPEAAAFFPAYHDTAAILYTSGTTGPSKGVIIPWAQAYQTATGMYDLEDFDENDAWYSPFPLFHASGKLALYATAIFGGRFVLRGYFKTDEFWDDIDRFECSIFMVIGATPAFIWNLPPSPDDRNHPLKYTLMAPMPDDPDAFVERYGWRLCTVFNMTEISSPVRSSWERGPKGSAGRIRPGYQVRIVDEHDEEVPPGVLGEIAVRSDDPWVLMAGYWKNPEATVKAWRNYWFHTGDAGRYDEEGWYYYVDRLKDAIRVSGENVSSMEVEAVVLDSPDVIEAAAVGVPSEFGEESIKLYVVAATEDFDAVRLMDFLKPRLPRFMMPRYVVAVDELPKTPTEKVRKHLLRERPMEPDAWDRVEAGYEIPR
jgi:crotonobetaine/carnitine-CoA ligase